MTKTSLDNGISLDNYSVAFREYDADKNQIGSGVLSFKFEEEHGNLVYYTANTKTTTYDETLFILEVEMDKLKATLSAQSI